MVPAVSGDDFVQHRMLGQNTCYRVHEEVRRRHVQTCPPELLEPAHGLGHVHGDLESRKGRAQYAHAIAQPTLGSVERPVGGARHAAPSIRAKSA
jgi:hypothetical protein